MQKTAIATVHFMDFNGGFWGLITESGERWRVAELPAELQKAGLKAQCTVELFPDAFSIYMWGTEADLLHYALH